MNGRIVCFGELLIRLGAPHGEILLQTPRLDVHYGGAEANVAVALARLGHQASMVSVVPDSVLADAAVSELRRHGVDTSHLKRAPGRMGLYFLTPGAPARPGEVLYDRAGSAFAGAPADAIDWDTVLDGAGILHVSGVTPALGERAASATIRAVQAATHRGITVSFDGNYRQKLWSQWRGDGPAILSEIMAHADVAFVNDRDIALICNDAVTGAATAERLLAASAIAFARFPKLTRIFATHRTRQSVDRHELSAFAFRRDRHAATACYRLDGIVDRIGSGDAFAAGVLHGLMNDMGDEDAADFGLAAAVLKHSIRGDFNLIDRDEVIALLAGDDRDIRR